MEIYGGICSFQKSVEMDKYPMKAIATTLILTLMFTGCAEKERYAERYLDSIGLILHMNRSAEVAGFLRQGASPSHTVEYPDLSGISRLSFTCNQEDSSRISEQLSLALIPSELSASGYDGCNFV